MAVVTANGGFATTRNGRLGSRRSPASACTMVTGQPRNRSRSSEARPGWSSTATTRAPAATRCAVEPRHIQRRCRARGRRAR